MKGRYYYATTAGGFAEKEIEVNDYTRGQGLQVLATIDRAVETGFLAAAPKERACTWCDFRPVCGPREEERTRGKAKDRLADLERFMRGLPTAPPALQVRHPMRSAWWILPFAMCLSAEWWLRRRRGVR